MVCANNSGCTGARINHINLPKTETIDKICRFTHWFCKNYDKYRGKDKTMDFDQHELLALIAPRLLCVASATEDHWAGQVGEWWGAKLASPAWELYGKKGLVEDAWPRAEKPQQEGFVSYHMRTGNHDLTPYDWGRYMDFADRHGWRSPSAADMDARPETWFHVIGGNASKAAATGSDLITTVGYRVRPDYYSRLPQ